MNVDVAGKAAQLEISVRGEFSGDGEVEKMEELGDVSDLSVNLSCQNVTKTETSFGFGSTFRNVHVVKKATIPEVKKDEKYDVEVSVIIPAMNEEETIGICIKKVKEVFEKYGIKGEIIVSDSSTDRTPEIAQSLGAKVVKPDKKGYGYAYMYAFKHARGKYIVIGDADDTYDFREIPKLLEPLQKGEADLVMGSRFKGEIKKGAMPWLHKYIGNPLLTFILNLFFKAGVSDSHSGFRAFTREALEKMNLRCHGMEFASEMIIEAARKGLKIVEVPIVYYPRKGDSKLRSFSDGWRHLKFMLMQTPKWLYYIPGSLMLTFGLAIVVAMSFTRLKFGSISLGIHSMVASSFLAIVGYQLTFLGLFSSVYAKKFNIGCDKLSEKILSSLTLERGLLVGLLLFGVGFFYILMLLYKWFVSGYSNLPLLYQDVFAFTLMIVGLQTIFYSFYLSLIKEQI